MAHQHYRTKGIILKKEDRGEADQLFTVFTEKFGKLEVLGRAIRKITSKLRSGAELFYLSEIEFIQGKSYKTLTDAILIEKFQPAFQMAEALDCLVGREQKDDEIWRLLLEVFSKEELPLTFHYFFWKLLDILGYKPELFNCACCHKKLLPETLFFSPEDGGVICWQCNKDKEVKGILVDTIKALRLLLSEPIMIIDKLKLDKATEQNLQEISQFYLSHLKEMINPQSRA